MKIKVSCIQYKPPYNNAPLALEVMLRKIKQAITMGAKIILLPELSLSGYMYSSEQEIIDFVSQIPDNYLEEIEKVCLEHKVIILFGAPTIKANKIYNSCIVIDDKGEMRTYHKAHLWNEETKIFSPGNSIPLVFDSIYGRIAVMICYDLEFSEFTRIASIEGADIILAPVNWPEYLYNKNDEAAERSRVRAAASINRTPIAVCDRVGIEKGQKWLGGSLIVDINGYTLAKAKIKQEGIIIAEVDIAGEKNKWMTKNNNVINDRRKDLYRLDY